MSTTEAQFADKVNQAIAKAGIDPTNCMVSKLIQKGLIADGWECDEWEVTLSSSGNKQGIRKFTVEYRQGIGFRDRVGKPEAPKLTGVIASVCRDGMLASASFEEFCGELGLDTDSRKALDCYLQSQRYYSGLCKVFGRQLLNDLEEILQDY